MRAIRREDRGGRLTDDLFSSVSVDTLRRRVPADDEALEVSRHDRVACRVQNRCQSAIGLLRLAPFGDITYEGAKDISTPGRCRRDRNLDGELVAVTMPCFQLESLVEDGPFAGFEKSPETPAVGFAVALGDDRVSHHLADDLRPCPTEDSFGHRIPVRDLALGVHRHDRIQRGVEDAAPPLRAEHARAAARKRGIARTITPVYDYRPRIICARVRERAEAERGGRTLVCILIARSRDARIHVVDVHAGRVLREAAVFVDDATPNRVVARTV